MATSLRFLVLLFSGFLLVSSLPAYAQEEPVQADGLEEADYGLDLMEAEEPSVPKADKADAAVADPKDTAADAVRGTVSAEVSPFYDIYQRQIGYKSSAKEFRKSLEDRTHAYETGRSSIIDKYRGNIDVLFKEESKEYQKNIAVQTEEQVGEVSGATTGADEESVASVSDQPGEDQSGTSGTAAPDDAAPAEGVKEKVIEESDSEAKPRKKIIMPEDAPDF